MSEKKINKEMIFRFSLALTFWTIVFFPALFVPRKLQYNFLFPIFTRLFLWAAKVRTHNLSNIDINKYGNIIFAGNHKNFVDTYIVTDYVRIPFTIMLKKEMIRNPFFRLMAWKMGLIPVDRAETLSQKDSFEKTKKILSKDYSLIMFPEGWYHFDMPVGKLKKGIAKIAKETGIKVMPIGIYGVLNNFIYEKKLYWKDAFIKAAEPIKYSDHVDDKAFLDALRSKIEILYLNIENTVKELNLNRMEN